MEDVAGADETSDRSKSPVPSNAQWAVHSNALQATTVTLRTLIGESKDGMLPAKEVQGMIRDAAVRYMAAMLGPASPRSASSLQGSWQRARRAAGNAHVIPAGWELVPFTKETFKALDKIHILSRSVSEGLPSPCLCLCRYD